MFNPKTDFCHISPTPMLNEFCSNRKIHLTLAHLIETDSAYVEFYKRESDNGAIIIGDNSCFEMYKQGRPMYPMGKLIEMNQQVGAKYIVMSDYPNTHSSVTIDAAKTLAPQLREAGFGTFFCPQSKIGDLQDLTDCFQWAATSDLVDYIGVSILAVPNAFGVERDNKLQRFLSRWKFMNHLASVGVLDLIVRNNKKIHFLGMLDGPNEIDLIRDFWPIITSWDSSSAVWAGLNGIQYDISPTGLIGGKFEKEVEFSFTTTDAYLIECAHNNINFISEKGE